MRAFNKIKSYICFLKNNKYTIYVFMLSIIIIFNIFFKIGNNKEGYSLLDLKGNITFKLISILFLITHLYILCSTFYFLFRKKNKENKIIFYMHKYLHKIYWQPLNIFYDNIAPNIPYSGTVILYITNLIENKSIFHKLMKYSYLIVVLYHEFLLLLYFFLILFY